MATTTGSCGLFLPNTDQLAPEEHVVTENVFESDLADIVIIGVTRLSGLRVALDNAQVSGELVTQLATQHSMHSAPPSVTRKVIGAGPHDEIMAFYSRYGRLAAHQIQRLMVADLPAPIAMLVRLESDSVEKLPLEVSGSSTPNDKGNRRIELITHTTRRTTSLSVKMLDLRNGREVQNRVYTYKKESQYKSQYAVGSVISQQDPTGNDSDSLDIANEALYPLPAPLFRSIVELLKLAVNDLHTATRL